MFRPESSGPRMTHILRANPFAGKLAGTATQVVREFGWFNDTDGLPR